ncbi:hypothetical protein Tdes44962_MAKER00113 [Teratosphaeria destructans]|uniref:Uncharacterized protein n=1 Tax=Teratosphaeria destructans TaxID=418781 RepID=A0A9W7T328_9PEZI|nr:hypothetical protein Tdes44962_MAKER00113 [Teratosphaeria destructans]
MNPVQCDPEHSLAQVDDALAKQRLEQEEHNAISAQLKSEKGAHQVTRAKLGRRSLLPSRPSVISSNDSYKRSSKATKSNTIPGAPALSGRMRRELRRS